MKNNLIAIMSKKDMSISDVSRISGISRTTLTDIAKNRKNNITLKKALNLCKVLQCDVADIFSEVVNSTQK